MLTVIVSMFLFALVGAISPGPVNIIATSSGVNFGFIRTLPHVIGASVSYAVIVFLVGFGLNEVLGKLPELTVWLSYICGFYLLLMSYRIANAPVTKKQIETILKEAAPGYWDGVLSQSLNPKAWLVSMSGISLFVSGHSSENLYLLIFCLISLIVCFVGVGTWALMGQLINNYLSDEKYQVSFNRIMALILASTVIAMFVKL